MKITICMALAHLHKEMVDLLCDYQQGQINKEFFLKAMMGTIDLIDNIVRENGNYNCSYARNLRQTPHPQEGKSAGSNPAPHHQEEEK